MNLSQAKQYALICLLSLSNMVLWAQQNDKLKIQHLTGNFYVFTTYQNLNGYLFPSNGMYLVTQEGAVLFDTPWDTTQFRPLLDSIASRHHTKVVLALATHYHDDRTAGFDFYKMQGIPTYSSKATFDLCKQFNQKQADYYFENDTVFKIGDAIFETFFPGEGHTKDNIVLWFEKEKVLYGGCLIKSTENKSLGNIADANLTEWTTTIRKVMKQYPNPQFVIPGHFGWSNNQSLQHTLKLLNKHRPK
ncbi:MAG: BlaB/IND/MUS family subclass B1 metallo-beta-lactamase [Bacteroidia bacterium]|nr:BlaB/IND/MUS family subclass B1 metallo-beta-lactamase [Bacteroidia bacterium]